MAEVIVLRLVHILGGMFWVGTALFTSVFLLPALGEGGGARQAVLAGLQRRRLFAVMPLVAIFTILSGARLMWITSGGFAGSYFASAMGLTYGVSGALAVLSFVLGIIIVRPTGVRMGAIGADLARATDDSRRAALSAEMGKLQRRNERASLVVVLLVVLAGAGMAVARYLV